MRIVIADDSILVRQRLVQLLSEVEGIEIVAEADDAPQARSLVATLKPDVAILDVLMPTGSGADLLPDLLRLEPAPRIIMLTNFPHPEVRKKCMSGGAEFFFDKSTEFQKVLTVLKGMARRGREKPSVVNVDMGLSEKELEGEIAKRCSPFGKVKQVSLHLCRGAPLARPFALVSMESPEQTETLAAAIGRHALGGSAIVFLRHVPGPR